MPLLRCNPISFWVFTLENRVPTTKPMNLRLWSFLLLTVTLAAARDPLALHPENPHYFLWRGKPAVLITSAEHYGAVVNLDFAYIFDFFFSTRGRPRPSASSTTRGARIARAGSRSASSGALNCPVGAKCREMSLERPRHR